MIVCNCLEDVELCYAGYCSRNGIQMDGACSTRHFQGLGCAVRSRLTMSSLIALLPAPWTRSRILWPRWQFFWAFGSRFCFQILLTYISISGNPQLVFRAWRQVPAWPPPTLPTQPLCESHAHPSPADAPDRQIYPKKFCSCYLGLFEVWKVLFSLA